MEEITPFFCIIISTFASTSLQDDSTRLNMELQKIRDLEARLMQERCGNCREGEVR